MMGLNVQCKKCANLRNDWCKFVVDSPDPDMVRDCQYYMGKTNADKLRHMSDEELAAWHSHLAPCCHCKAVPEERNQVIHPHDCYEKWLEWLKQEAKRCQF